jgi:hypothetical protein
MLTIIRGRTTIASSPRQASVGAISSSPEFIDQMVSAGWAKRRTDNEGCGWKETGQTFGCHRGQNGIVARGTVFGVIGLAAYYLQPDDIGEIRQALRRLGRMLQAA